MAYKLRQIVATFAKLNFSYVRIRTDPQALRYYCGIEVEHVSTGEQESQMKTDQMNTAVELGRSDADIEAAVNRGLAAALLSDTKIGAEVMLKEGVPPHVVRRVLKSPQKRRFTDWK